MRKVERALIAYTVLKGHLERGDLYEGLMVFFRPVTASLAGKIFIPSELADELRNRYALYIPPLVLDSLAEKMVKAKLLKVRGQSAAIVSYEYLETELVQNSVSLPKITQILDEFKTYFRQFPDPSGGMADGEIEEEFFKRLLHIESLRILSRRDGIESPKRTSQTLGIKKPPEETSETDPKERHIDYLVSRFILTKAEGDAPAFDLLCDVASANLGTEALLSYREPPKHGEALEELDIFLDSPLCLDILGVNPGREDYGQQLASELKRSGCKLHVFLHSILEIERVLESRKQSYLAGLKPFDYFQADPPAIRDLVRAIAGHAEEILKDRYGVQVVDSAVAIPAGRRSSVGAEEEKAVRMALAGWQRDDAREADVSSCCDLIRLRSGREVQTRITKAGPLLVTRNSTLARTANTTWKNWLQSTARASRDRARDAAPLSITDKHFVGLVWITQGGTSGTLSRAHLVANCSAAVATRKDVITRVYNTLLDTSENAASIFAAIINDHRAERAVMDKTFGDPDIVTSESVIPLLEEVKRSTAEEITKQKNAEIANITGTFAIERKVQEGEAARLALERDDAQAQLIAAHGRVRNLELADQGRQYKLLSKACGKGRVVYFGVVIVAVVLLSGLSFVLQSMVPTGEDSSLVRAYGDVVGRWLVPGGIAVLTAIWLGWDMPDFLIGRVRDRVSQWGFLTFVRRYGVDALRAEYQCDCKTGILKRDDEKAVDSLSKSSVA